jgi:hypothetical protein
LDHPDNLECEFDVLVGVVVAKHEKKKKGWWCSLLLLWDKRRLKKNKLQLQQTRTKKLSILLEKNWGPAFLNFYYNLELSALEKI